MEDGAQNDSMTARQRRKKRGKEHGANVGSHRHGQRQQKRRVIGRAQTLGEKRAAEAQLASARDKKVAQGEGGLEGDSGNAGGQGQRPTKDDGEQQRQLPPPQPPPPPPNPGGWIWPEMSPLRLTAGYYHDLTKQLSWASPIDRQRGS